MAPPSYDPAGRRGGVPAAAREDRRSWLWHGLTALAISALGLAAAGSVALTSSAEGTSAVQHPRPSVTLGPSVKLAPIQPGYAPRASSSPVDPTNEDPALVGFAARDRTTGTAPTRSAGLRTAITKEQAAQRSEDLAKTAEAVTRSSRTASGNARQQDLSAAEQDRQVTSAKLAAENLRRAVAARLAAAAERRLAEQQQAARELAEQQQAEQQQAQQQQAQQQQATQQQQAQQQQAQQQATQQRATQQQTGPQRAMTQTPASTTPGVLTGGDSVSTGGGGASPVPGAVIGSHFGAYGPWSRYHTGLDFRAAYGTPIRAVRSGVVLYAGNSGDWAGNYVAIQHGDGQTTMSSHLSSMVVQNGQAVRAGQLIGYVGQTGRAFGAHLHFELYPVGVRYGDVYQAVNPQPWLVANGVRTR